MSREPCKTFDPVRDGYGQLVPQLCVCGFNKWAHTDGRKEVEQFLSDDARRPDHILRFDSRGNVPAAYRYIIEVEATETIPIRMVRIVVIDETTTPQAELPYPNLDGHSFRIEQVRIGDVNCMQVDGEFTHAWPWGTPLKQRMRAVMEINNIGAVARPFVADWHIWE